MKVYIFIKKDNFDYIDDYYVYKTREVAEKYYKHLGSDRFAYSIKELELLEE